MIRLFNIDKWKENKNKWPKKGQWLAFLIAISRTERIILFFLLILGLGAGVSWWRISYLENTKVVPTKGGILREVMVGQPQSLNPLFALLNDADRDISELIFAGLLKYDQEGSLIKDLAKDYKISKDGKIYEFTLEDNLFWSDGEEITTQDIVFTIESVRNPEVQSPLRLIWQEVKVEKTDNKTIKFILPNPYPPFLENFTFKILPYHIFNKVSPQAFILEPPQNLTSSGQFEIKVIEKDSENKIRKIILERNPNFHGKASFLEKIEITFIPTTGDFPTWKNKALSFAGISSEQKSIFKENFNIYKLSVPRYFALFLNQNKSILSQKEVREALAFATPKNEIIEKILLGEARIIDSPFLPENRIEGDFKQYKFNLKKAQEILEKAGWQDKDKDGIREKILKEGEKATPLKLILFTVEQEELKKAAEIIQARWKEIGVKLVIRTLEPTKLLQENIKERKYDILLFGQGLSIIPDPYPFWSSFQKEYPGLNLSLYQNKDVDELLKNSREELNSKKRRGLLQKAQQKITDDIPAIFLYSPYYLYAVRDEVKGI
ncbi:MAG: hypothetical protein CO034_00915, partial [Parcubacteria group bacterium CG_4_9_14_0_2_um_filter_35_11]